MILNYCQDQFQTRLNINNIQISQVKETRLLGCIIRDDLKWVSNTNDLIKRAYARMTILRKLVQFEVPKCDLVHIYTLFIRSILEQSCVVWGAAITQEESKALKRVQKCCLKLIFQDQYISYENGLLLAGLSDLENRRNKLSYRFAKRCTENPKAKHMFPKNEWTKSTRNPEQYKVPFAYHSRLKNSAIPKMSRLLNEKP